MNISPTTRMGISTTKLVARAPPILYAIITEKMKFKGARRAILISIIKPIWTF